MALQQTPSGVRLRLWAERTEAKNVLEEAVEPLLQALETAGIRVAGLTVASDGDDSSGGQHTKSYFSDSGSQAVHAVASVMSGDTVQAAIGSASQEQVERGTTAVTVNIRV